MNTKQGGQTQPAIRPPRPGRRSSSQRAQPAAKVLDGNRPVLKPALREDGHVDAKMGLDAAPGDFALERVEIW